MVDKLIATVVMFFLGSLSWQGKEYIRTYKFMYICIHLYIFLSVTIYIYIRLNKFILMSVALIHCHMDHSSIFLCLSVTYSLQQ